MVLIVLNFKWQVSYKWNRNGFKKEFCFFQSSRIHFESNQSVWWTSWILIIQHSYRSYFIPHGQHPKMSLFCCIQTVFPAKLLLIYFQFHSFHMIITLFRTYTQKCFKWLMSATSKSWLIKVCLYIITQYIYKNTCLIFHLLGCQSLLL